MRGSPKKQRKRGVIFKRRCYSIYYFNGFCLNLTVSCGLVTFTTFIQIDMKIVSKDLLDTFSHTIVYSPFPDKYYLIKCMGIFGKVKSQILYPLYTRHKIQKALDECVFMPCSCYVVWNRCWTRLV